MPQDNLPRVLVVDDDPTLTTLIDAVLSDDYAITLADSGELALAKLDESVPDIVIMDIGLPGMSGYEACRQIKIKTKKNRDIPVIFLSGTLDLDNRLAAYDAGAEDFLGKPFVPAELRAKVALTLRTAKERVKLSLHASEAYQTAMTAMTTAGEVGVVLQYLRHSFTCSEYHELADAAIKTCAAHYGLSVSVQIRGAAGTVSRNDVGDATANEESVLTTLATCGRIVTLGRRAAFSFPGVTLLVRDMPLDDQDRCGRMRDNLALLAEGADARVQALDAEIAVRKQRASLHRLATRTRDALNDIDLRYQAHKSEAVMIMHSMLNAVENSFYSLGLSELQEEAVTKTLHDAAQQIFELFGRGLAVDEHIRQINSDLDHELAQNWTMKGIEVSACERTAPNHP